MTKYPEVQIKCQEEIEAIVGNKSITYSDRSRLKYVDAIINEVQRYSRPSTTTLLHATRDDTILKERTINVASIPSGHTTLKKKRRFNVGIESILFQRCVPAGYILPLGSPCTGRSRTSLTKIDL